MKSPTSRSTDCSISPCTRSTKRIGSAVSHCAGPRGSCRPAGRCGRFRDRHRPIIPRAESATSFLLHRRHMSAGKSFERVAVEPAAPPLIGHGSAQLSPRLSSARKILAAAPGCSRGDPNPRCACQRPPAARASSQLARRGDQRAEVQRPGGRWREPAGIHGCLEYTARFFPEDRDATMDLTQETSRRPSTKPDGDRRLLGAWCGPCKGLRIRCTSRRPRRTRVWCLPR